MNGDIQQRLGVRNRRSIHGKSIDSPGPSRLVGRERLGSLDSSLQPKMPITPLVTEQTLIEGVWFAVEQSGRLLQSAVLLCNTGDYSSGLVMAMFSREELGRSRLLMEIATEVRSGANVKPSKVTERCKGHLDKHAAGALSLAFRPEPGDQMYVALQNLDSAARGSQQWFEADAVVKKLTEEQFKVAPKSRHAARMGAMYVDIADDGRGWGRPVTLDEATALNAVNDASNDYSLNLQRFDPKFAAAKQAIDFRPDVEALHKYRPPDLTLPAAVWLLPKPTR